MDMENIVKESHEEFGQDEDPGAISILKDPENPFEKDIQHINDKNGLSSWGLKKGNIEKKDVNQGLLVRQDC